MSLIVRKITAGGRRFRIFHADTYAELPVSGLSIGEKAFAVDTLTEYIATTSTVWSPLSYVGVGGVPHAASHEPGGNDAMAVDAATGTGSLRTIGTGAAQACAGDDARLSDARAPTAHGHPISDVTSLQTSLDGKALASHSHAQGDVTNLVTDLAGKAASAHTHGATDIDSGTIATARLGSGAPDGTKFLRDDSTWQTPTGGGGSSLGGAGPVVLHHPHMAASAAATNLAVNVFNAVSDPNFRQMCDLRGYTKVRIQGRIGGALVAATALRVQYHLGGNPAVATGDAGWATLATTAGSHTVNVMFYSAEIAVPAGAQVNNVLIRVGLFSGNGAADPTITCCILNLYA